LRSEKRERGRSFAHKPRQKNTKLPRTSMKEASLAAAANRWRQRDAS
jgi:hypothetical protein